MTRSERPGVPAAPRVERMTEDDVAAVAALDPAARMDADALRAELARPFSHAWVAREDDGAVVGYGLAWLVVDEIHVLNLATRIDRRRLGIGREVLATLLRVAREAGARRALLEVRRSNVAAIELYRGAGFELIGTRARYYPDDEDALEMALEMR
jgi:ribosomal-protein-alanine N-acetyltransferase